MIKCGVCNHSFRQITRTHLKKHNMSFEEYRSKFPDLSLVSDETYNKLSVSQKGKKVGDDNPSRRPEVREKISQSVKSKWEDGNYDERVNGMLGRTGELSRNYKPENHTFSFLAKKNYRELLSQFQSIDHCALCPRDAINIHHIDEDRDNFLLSNLIPLCRPCHSMFHYKFQKQPFIVVGKTVTFAASHKLPRYNGPCGRWHGHEWSLTVEVKRRVHPTTGMVIDFTDLKKIITECILNKFDHNVVNDHIENPTAENMLVYFWNSLMLDGLLKGINSITLYETPTSSSKLTEKNMLDYFSCNLPKYLDYDEFAEVLNERQ